MTSTPSINVEKALQILSEDGPLSKFVKGFEPRNAQKLMMHNILEAYNQNKIALVEAGTGTGKSMAYLIPAMLWALQRKERTVISTHTITLQEQLLHKDIPLLVNALGLDVKVVIAKGMRNYVCLRKLEELQSEILLLDPLERDQYHQLQNFAEKSKDGSKASLPFEPLPSLWDKTCAENDTCSKNQCPYFQECHFFKARKEASDAQIVIVNHHLLFADLAARAEANNYEDAAILPIYTKVILDEAHHIEDIATEYLADKVNLLDLLRIVGRLAAEKGTSSLGKLAQLKDRIVNCYKTTTPPIELTQTFALFNIDLPAIKADLLKQITEGFDRFYNFINIGKIAKENDESSENKLRVLPTHYDSPYWQKEVKIRINELNDVLKKYVQTIYSIENTIKALNHDQLNEQTKGIRFEIEALCNRLTLAAEVLKQFVEVNPPTTKVRWIEAQLLKSFINVNIADAELDIAASLANYLFNKFDSVILCSATLTTNQKFDFMKKRLGLVDKYIHTPKLTENIYDSPFQYKSQAILIVPTDIPSPLESNFTDVAVEKIWDVVQASRGNAFVLFTSYSMLKICHEKLQVRFEEHRYPLLKQGDGNRQTLLNKFKELDRSVLFGTDSFWEGVDVAGDALRCVVIVKLPFKVPTEPIIQARTEAISSRGGDAFMEFSLPNAIVKFKQGFGRLIRNKNDRGCIVCLDNRLITKRYGKQFLNSLPACEKVFTTSDQLKSHMQDFYRKTYYLTQN